MNDIRYALRQLLKHPGFAAVAALTLGLGIAANTTIFSVVNMFLFRPLPVERPEELAMVFVGNREAGRVWNPHSYPEYVDVRDQNSVFAGLAAYKTVAVAISAGEPDAGSSAPTEVVQGELVSGNYFEVLRVRPVLGRAFSSEEDRTPNAHPVVVLGYGFWQRHFRSDPELVGRAVHLNGRPFTVIGIAPPSFKGTVLVSEMKFWAPLMMQAQLGGVADWLNGGGHDLSVLGRLKSGVTRQQAEAHLNTLAQTKAGQNESRSESIKFSVVSEIEGRHPGFGGQIMLIAALALGASGLVLLIACANVANLLLARATARSREIVIRLAMGAGRWRILRQLLTESMLLALIGGVLGLLLALWGAELMRISHPFLTSTPEMPLQPIVVDFSPDWRVFNWALGVSLLTGLLFGLAPAWHAARTDLVPALKNEEGGTGHSARHFSPRHLLVIVQLAISVVVLASAGPFVKRLYQAQVADPGFQTANLLSVRLDPGLVGYDAAKARLFFTELVRQVETLPGVRTASLAHGLPFAGGGMVVWNVLREGDPPPPPRQGMEPMARSFGSAYFETPIGPKYFATMGTPLLAGREFTERDDGKAPAVVILNQAAARRLFGNEQQALGQRVRLEEPESALMEIIGIAQDGHLAEPHPSLFRPFLQRAEETRMTLFVRATSAQDFTAIAGNVRRAAQGLDARVPVFQLKLADDHVRPVFRALRFFAAVATTLAALALGLAALGLYAMLAYAVNLRTKEVGIRMALGAQSADVLGLVLRQGMFLTSIGLALGLITSLGVTRVVMHLFHGANTMDPMMFIAIGLVLAAIALLACYLPARRATKVDPLVALRHE
jgi:putative ABC transport system permease protein